MTGRELEQSMTFGRNHELTFICLRSPLSEEGMTLAEAARELHRQEIDSIGLDFPSLPLAENRFIAVAHVADRIVGYVSAEILTVHDSEWYLKWMVVAQEWRSRGIGTALLGVAANRAKQAGAPSVLLSPLIRDNDRLFQYYSDRGFHWVKARNTVPHEYFESTPERVIEVCGLHQCLTV